MAICYKNEEFEDEVVSVKTFREKTARALDIPDVMFPIMVLPYLTFHVDFIRPILIKRRRIPMSDIFKKNQPLLVHTRTGEYLTPANISHSIRCFMRGVDPRLTNVKAMTLRASYATSMLHSYRQGKFDDNKLSEDEFLSLVAKQMNTSVEQLRGTYMASYSKDFKQTMKLFTKHFSIVMNENGDDKDVYVEDCEHEESEEDERLPPVTMLVSQRRSPPGSQSEKNRARKKRKLGLRRNDEPDSGSSGSEDSIEEEFGSLGDIFPDEVEEC